MKKTYGWIITLVIPCLVYLCAPEDVNPKLPLFMGMTSMAVCAWVFNVFQPIGVAALLMFGYLLGGVAGPQAVFRAWSTVLPWLSFAAIVLGVAMDKTGLARRVALSCVKICEGSFTGLAWGFIIGGIVLASFMSSILARMVILCAIACGIIDSLRIDGKSRLSSAIIFMAFIGASGPQFLLIHSSESNIWAFQELFKGTDIVIDFWKYALHSTLFSIIYTICSMLLIYLIKGREQLSGEEVRRFLKQSWQEIGPMKGPEKKLSLICLLLVAAFMLQPWIGVNPVYFFCVLALLCYMPGINILDEKSLPDLNIMFLIFVTGCMSIGFVGGEVGFNAWVVHKIVPLLSGWSDTVSVLMSYFLGVIINFLLTPLAALGAFTPAIGEMSHAMNVNPLPIFYSFNYGIDQYVFPYETVYFLYIFITGKITLRHIIPALLLRMLLCGLLIMCLAVPWWKLIGLM